ncbi:MAG: single-stranded DNA-binding protein [Planctomycetota bacterium]
MASFNKVILLGNVTRDPELRYIANGTAVTDIGLAVNDRRKTATGEWVEETTFVDVTLWGRTAEIAGEYVTKGSPLLIDGRLKLDTWEKDGKKNSKLRVVCDRMQLLGGRGGESRPGDASRGKSRPAAAGRGGPSQGDLAQGDAMQGGPRGGADDYDQSGGYDVGVSGSNADFGAGGESRGGGDDDIPF